MNHYTETVCLILDEWDGLNPVGCPDHVPVRRDRLSSRHHGIAVAPRPSGLMNVAVSLESSLDGGPAYSAGLGRPGGLDLVPDLRPESPSARRGGLLG